MTIVDGPPKAGFALQNFNPDVLTCIANLSNDEVFTPPDFANRMLDTLEGAWAEANDGASIWSDPTVTFLDPFTKSGVFLREITARLTAGLEQRMPDLQQRVDHILTKQVFGIATTTLTSLVARRSLYCSKDATGKHSIATSFDRDWGNVWFERTEHTWAGDRCGYCGASKSEYDRAPDLESHAYAFIHSKDPKRSLAQKFGADVQFDVIIGNPPYQLETGGSGRQARPIYNLFVDQAKLLEPRHVVMVIQSRWFGGGMGLGDFRASMLGDHRLRTIVDYTNSNEVFPGTDFGGGACYFHWDREYDGDCTVVNHLAGRTFESQRALDEFPHFIRYSPALPVLRKVLAADGGSLRSIVSSTRPFGIPTTAKPSPEGDYRLVSSKGSGRIGRSAVTNGHELVDSWKVLVSKTSHDHAGLPDRNGQRRVLSRLELLEPGAVCSESYIVVGRFGTQAEAEHCLSYLQTRFARFFISLVSYSQDITSARFEYVPMQDFTRPWNDAALYERYDITADEIAFIESLIRPMELEGA